MTNFSERQTGEYKRVSVVLFLAALYNVLWGSMAAAAPVKMLALFGIKDPGPIELWQCIGMFVALYGVGYWFASTDPARYWPFALIGLCGKVLGPVGALIAITSGRLPAKFLWVNVTNDFVWWIPFTWALWVVWRWNMRLALVDEASQEVTLYQRVMGSAFDELTPNVRRFHAARQPVKVRGVFRVTRGESALGNWLTDRAGFPSAHDALAVSLAVQQTAGGEIWRRSFAGATVESRQFEAHGFLVEKFGPLVLYLQPRANAGALEITDVRSTLMGVPLPPFLTPRVWARGIDSGGDVDVLVRISCAPLGLLVEYSGIVGSTEAAAP